MGSMLLCLWYILGQGLEQSLEYYWLLNQVLEEGLGGTVTSVNFPNNYQDNTDCAFTILPVPGNHVTLQVNLTHATSPRHIHPTTKKHHVWSFRHNNLVCEESCCF